MTSDKIDDWQIVARQTNDRAGPLINYFMRLVFLLPEPPQHSSVTWTIRHVLTGDVRKITARSEDEFAERLAAGVFD